MTLKSINDYLCSDKNYIRHSNGRKRNIQPFRTAPWQEGYGGTGPHQSDSLWRGRRRVVVRRGTHPRRTDTPNHSGQRQGVPHKYQPPTNGHTKHRGTTQGGSNERTPSFHQPQCGNHRHGSHVHRGDCRRVPPAGLRLCDRLHRLPARQVRPHPAHHFPGTPHPALQHGSCTEDRPY